MNKHLEIYGDLCNNITFQTYSVSTDDPGLVFETIIFKDIDGQI